MLKRTILWNPTSLHITYISALKVHSTCRHLQAMDSQEITCLTLLDLSAAFDSIDHEVLLRRLEKKFRIKRTVNKWIVSYLTNQYQHVITGDVNTDGATSDPMRVTQGIPQGLFLGPILIKLCKVLLVTFAGLMA